MFIMKYIMLYTNNCLTRWNQPAWQGNSHSVQVSTPDHLRPYKAVPQPLSITYHSSSFRKPGAPKILGFLDMG